MEDGLNVAQVSAKTLEEDWKVVNHSLFSQTLYFVSIAIESLKQKEIADFIYSRSDSYMQNTEFDQNTAADDIQKLLQDIYCCKQMLEQNEYKVRETSDSTKSRIDYILSLAVD
ncbi:hypothetical protein B5M42_012925 [Paenibacillus athensensis]|nr:hypothetical protein [Paenibacillus athensensis]MCD1259737.1 hypothetical protein [Paenibacillus athensensis]